MPLRTVQKRYSHCETPLEEFSKIIFFVPIIRSGGDLDDSAWNLPKSPSALASTAQRSSRLGLAVEVSPVVVCSESS